MIIAVDFDGTLCKNEFPKIGKQNLIRRLLMRYLIKKQKQGHSVVLWTCRNNTPIEGCKPLDEAVEWCREKGLVFDKINEEANTLYSHLGFTRKLYSDVYIDDKNMGFLGWFLRNF